MKQLRCGWCGQPVDVKGNPTGEPESDRFEHTDGNCCIDKKMEEQMMEEQMMNSRKNGGR